ncbi:MULTISPECIES: DUF736 family protein [Brevundimonas]|uniref:DUF736 domain-containing protein n=1 Tax=Brevundimonas TaxID=41275 RepID=UPI001904AE67|nr:MULTISPECIES: DUF736 family protein [Brevundimonas]MBK1967784.1 DUF736 family protein [Brevundimonas diminuta]MBK1975352.1 DUF736 family protein [Brevundimonas diminuta]
MGVIGKFKPTKQGGWEGRIETLLIDRKIRFVPNDDRRNDNSPDYVVMLGWSRVGEAWKATSRGENPRDYLRVRLNDPWSEPKRATLFPAPDGATAELVWSRQHRMRDWDDEP